MNVPDLCERSAFEFFAQQLPALHTFPGLLRASIAVSMHALDDVRPSAVEKQIRELGERVRGRVRSPQLQARLAHLHEVLFEEEGFEGNVTSYYSPLNSYLPAVLESRRGIPVTLSLVYAAVARSSGLHVVGLNTPQHFLVEVHHRSERVIVDPFVRGRILTVDEVHQLLYRSVPSAPGVRAPRRLPIATHQQWLSRIIGNLQHIFAQSGHPADLAAMTELHSALQLFATRFSAWPPGRLEGPSAS